ncbi:TRAP transporter small permease subunit [Citreimonas sp.]|uniref:TRAP transporter small permease subunit n=1 Tax=Citreimonas sp. TaxID=3036715 RepID=UPI00405969BD
MAPTKDDDAIARALAETDEDLPDIDKLRRPPDALPPRPRRIVVALDTFADWFGQVLAWLVLALVVVVVMESIRRYAFNAPSIWAYDVSYMLYGTIFMLGAAVTLRFRGHIRTDLFFNTWTPRTQAGVDLAFYILLFFPGMLFFLIAGYDQAARSYAISERAAASFWRPILWPYRAVIPLTAALVMLQGVSEIIKAWYQFRTGRPV